MKIGFIGQGWVGKNYADEFEARGYDIVRYALEKEYIGNKDKIAKCDIVFIAVPTPTTPKGFDDSIVRSTLHLVGKKKIAVIKSTVVPGTTESIQKEFPDIFVLMSPEFLVEASVVHDVANPNRNLVGIPVENAIYKKKAKIVLSVLPKAPYSKIMRVRDVEFVKYAGNCFLFTKVIFMNLLYDLVQSAGGDWQSVKEAFIHDPRVGVTHTEPIHKSGRGAGGDCFIKDFEAFFRMYKNNVTDKTGSKVLELLRDKNVELLRASGKDASLLKGVYGEKTNSVKASKVIFKVKSKAKATTKAKASKGKN